MGVFLLLGGMIQTGDERGGRTRQAAVDTANETRREMHYQAIRARAPSTCAAFEHAQMDSYPRQSAKRNAYWLATFVQTRFRMRRSRVCARVCTLQNRAPGTGFSYLSLRR